MPRPKKVGNARDLEQRDTLFWCGLIKAQCGLSDAQIEAKLNLSVDPNGRNFNRWLTGKRAMSHNDMQTLVKKARKVGLLNRRSDLGTHLQAAVEARAGADTSIRTSDTLQEKLKNLRDLHSAKQELMRAAEMFQVALSIASESGIDIFDTIDESYGPAGDHSLENTEINSIAKRIGEIASWYFLDGQAHTLS